MKMITLIIYFSIFDKYIITNYRITNYFNIPKEGQATRHVFKSDIVYCTICPSDWDNFNQYGEKYCH